MRYQLEMHRVICDHDGCDRETVVLAQDWAEFSGRLGADDWSIRVTESGGWSIASWEFKAFCPAGHT